MKLDPRMINDDSITVSLPIPRHLFLSFLQLLVLWFFRFKCISFKSVFLHSMSENVMRNHPCFSPVVGPRRESYPSFFEWWIDDRWWRSCSENQGHLRLNSEAVSPSSSVVFSRIVSEIEWRFLFFLATCSSPLLRMMMRKGRTEFLPLLCLTRGVSLIPWHQVYMNFFLEFFCWDHSTQSQQVFWSHFPLTCLA